MCKIHKHTGSTYMLVIMVFIFVSLFSAAMLTNLGHSIFQTHAYSMQMQCYYLNDQTAKAIVAVLLDNENELLKAINSTRTDTLKHTNAEGTLEVGESQIVLRREYHDYYGEQKAWIVGEIKTTIKDPRGIRQGEDFSYIGTVMVLVENPLIQLFNLNPEDF